MKFRSSSPGYITAHPLLQGQRRHRHPRRATCGRATGTLLATGDVHGRDRVGLAGDGARVGRADRRQHDLRGVLPLVRRLLRRLGRLLRAGRHERAPDRARGRDRRLERALPVRSDAGSRTQSYSRPTTGSDVVFSAPAARAGHDPADASSRPLRRTAPPGSWSARTSPRGSASRWRRARSPAPAVRFATPPPSSLPPSVTLGCGDELGGSRPDVRPRLLRGLHRDRRWAARAGSRTSRATRSAPTCTWTFTTQALPPPPPERGPGRADPGHRLTPATPSPATTPRSCGPRA